MAVSRTVFAECFIEMGRVAAAGAEDGFIGNAVAAFVAGYECHI